MEGEPFNIKEKGLPRDPRNRAPKSSSAIETALGTLNLRRSRNQGKENEVHKQDNDEPGSQWLSLVLCALGPFLCSDI